SPTFFCPLTHTSLLYLCHNHRNLSSFPTRRSSDLRSLITMEQVVWGEYTRAIPLLTPLRSTMSIRSPVTSTNSMHRVVEKLWFRSEEHTSELQSRVDLVCRLLLEKKNE